MHYCPCCSNVLLQHIRGKETYWFCRECWEEMPALELQNSYTSTRVVGNKMPAILKKYEDRKQTHSAA